MDSINVSRGRFERVRTRRKGDENHKESSKQAIKRETRKLRACGSHKKYKRVIRVGAGRAIKSISKRRKTRYSKDPKQGEGTRA
jgi:hypothetical protein